MYKVLFTIILILLETVLYTGINYFRQPANLAATVLFILVLHIGFNRVWQL